MFVAYNGEGVVVKKKKKRKKIIKSIKLLPQQIIKNKLLRKKSKVGETGRL